MKMRKLPEGAEVVAVTYDKKRGYLAMTKYGDLLLGDDPAQASALFEQYFVYRPYVPLLERLPRLGERIGEAFHVFESDLQRAIREATVE